MTEPQLSAEIVMRLASSITNDGFVVESVKTGLSVQAKVTDTGGFARHNRVADLSLATKEAIGCSSLCQVIITYENTN